MPNFVTVECRCPCAGCSETSYEDPDGLGVLCASCDVAGCEPGLDCQAELNPFDALEEEDLRIVDMAAFMAERIFS